MNPLSFIGKIFSGGNPIKDIGDGLNHLFTSDEERLEKKLEMQKADQEFQLAEDRLDADLAKGQQDINKIEAGSSNFFVAGWRPAVGWVCVSGLFYQFVLYQLMTWVLTWINAHWKLAPPIPPPPSLDTSTLMPLLIGMLGLGGLRTYEKVKGVATK